MQESARAAQSYLWSHAQVHIDPSMFKNYSVHLHAGRRIRKMDQAPSHDHGSAGILTGRRVRPDTSMTGEITLSGLCFRSGIKERSGRIPGGVRRIILLLLTKPM